MKTSLSLSFRIIARVLSAVAQAIILIILAREASPTIFGEFLVIYSVALLAANLASFGAAHVAIVSLPRLKLKEQKTLITSLVLIRAVGVGGVLVIVWLYGTYGLHSSTTLGAILLVYSETLVDIFQASLAGLGLQARSALIVLLSKPATLLVLLISFHMDLVFETGISIASVATIMLGMMFVIGYFGKPEFSLSLFRFSTGYWISSLTSNIRQIEPSLIAEGWSTAIAGGYAFASKIANPLLIIVSSLQSIFVPQLSSLDPNSKKFRDLERKIFIAVSIYAVLLIFVSPYLANVLILMLGEEYKSFKVLVVAVIVATGISAIVGALQISAYSRKMPYVVSIMVGLPSLIGVLSLVYGIYFENFTLQFLIVYPVAIQILMLVTGSTIFAILRVRKTFEPK